MEGKVVGSEFFSPKEQHEQRWGVHGVQHGVALWKVDIKVRWSQVLKVS